MSFCVECGPMLSDTLTWYSLPATKKTLNLQICLEGGQAFNWVKINSECWSAVFFSSIITLSYSLITENVIFNTIGPISTVEAYQFLIDYFRLDISSIELISKWRKLDPLFDSICDQYTGVRILRQDPFLTLLSFVCSSNNNIGRITKLVRSLYTSFGSPLEIQNNFTALTHSFPTFDQLLSVTDLENKLRILSFGYRAKYLAGTISTLSKLGLSTLYGQRSNPNYESVISFLLQFPGVGRKVADCTALFGLDQLSAFPIDVHIYRIAVKLYNLSSKSNKLSAKEYERIRTHFCDLFQVYPGWAQSILFTSQLKQFSNKL